MMLIGVQNITEYYAEGLSALGNDVTVVTGIHKTLKQYETYKNVRIIRHNIYTKRGKYYGDIKGYIDLIYELSNNADILINVCTQTATTDCILKKLKNIKCKKVLYMHGMADFRFPRIPLVKLYDVKRWLFNIIRWKPQYAIWKKYIVNYDMIIHLHKEDQSYKYTKLCGVDNNIVLENGADFDCEVDKNTEKLYWLCLSNYSYDKNQELVLKAYLKSNTKLDMMFIGTCENEYLKKLKKMIENNNSNKNVHFRYNLTREETIRALKNSYGLITGSKVEKYPVVISEAMKCGIPFISTDTGIVRYLPGGLIANNQKAIINAMDKLENDKEFRKEKVIEANMYAQQNQNMLYNIKYLNDRLYRLSNEEIGYEN